MPDTPRHCEVCGGPLRSDNRSGVCGRTPSCAKERDRRYRAGNRERINAGRRRHHAANRESRLLRNRRQQLLRGMRKTKGWRKPAGLRELKKWQYLKMTA